MSNILKKKTKTKSSKQILKAIGNRAGVANAKAKAKDDDDNDFSGPALGGRVKTQSDYSDDDDDDDKPVTMRSMTMMHSKGSNHLNVPTNRRHFQMEVFEL